MALLLLLLVAAIARDAGDAANEFRDRSLPESNVELGELEGEIDELPAREETHLTPGEVRLPPWLLIVLAVVTVIALGIVVARLVTHLIEQRRGRRTAPRHRMVGSSTLLEETDALPDEAATDAARRRLVIALDEVIEALRNDPDPRRAVIIAWARLEDLFAEHRLARRPAETPTAYVGRVLGHLDASGRAVTELTATFERAMFSPHVIARPDQLAAIDALLAVRHDLEARVR